MLKSQHLISRVFDMPIDIVAISSMLPDQIMHRVNQCDLSEIKSLVLVNRDPWRYGDDFRLHEFFHQLRRPVFVLHLGYHSRVVQPNLYEVAWQSSYLDRTVQEPCQLKSAGLPYGFSCLNNRYSLHRALLGYFLYQTGHLFDMIFTQNVYQDDRPEGFDTVILDGLTGFKDYQALWPIQWHREDHTDFVNDHRAHGHDAYELCYANIVTETESEGYYWPGIAVNTPLFSEKSFKPFEACQIPIFLAAKGHLDYVEHMGFETMAHVLPADYDQLGLFAKIQAIVRLVGQGRDHIEQIYHDHAREIEHNRDLFCSDSVDQKIIQDAGEFVKQVTP